MNTPKKLWAAAALVGALALGGCFGSDDDDDDAPVAGNGQPVPDSAGASTAAFLAFILALNPNDESSEPSAISDGFAVPPDETGDSKPLT
ncbi:MAG: hypothetical protein Q8R33_25275 [Burkholderiales bacterium]|nr:hypothetical protein [Burkholderiales bacterium]